MRKLIEMPEQGWLYIMMTPSDYSRIKIGMTKNNPLLRLRDLKTGDPYLALQAAYFIPINFGMYLRDAESLIHNYFCNLRIHFLDDEDQINKPSEWFKMDCRDSVSNVDNVFKNHGFNITDDTSNPFIIGSRTAIKYYEPDLIFAPCDLTMSFNNGL